MTLPPLWQHQIEGIKRAYAAQGKFAFFFDPGCGKTRTVLEIANGVAPRSPKILIIGPISVCYNWELELKEYALFKYKVRNVAGCTKLQKQKALLQFSSVSSDAQREIQILIVNIEMLRSAEYLALLEKSGANFIVVDESHKFKSPTSAQTKGLLQLLESRRPGHLYLLTGTPAPQGEQDLWSTFRIMGVTEYPFYVWRKKYFVDKNERRKGTKKYWPDYVVSPRAKEQFQAALARISLTAKKNKVLDLPPMLYTNLYADLSSGQQRHYDTMKEFLFAIDDDGQELNASNMLVRTLRLQQIVAGVFGESALDDIPRLDALDDAIEKVGGEQFIIWTIFRPTYQQIAERLDKAKLSYAMLTGDVEPGERADAIASFQAGEIRTLIAHPAAGGVGVNLNAASYSIHYTRSFSLVDDMQAEARNYRGGSERHERVTRIDIIAPKTIDEEITKALRAKKTVQDFILGLKQQHGEENGR